MSNKISPPDEKIFSLLPEQSKVMIFPFKELPATTREEQRPEDISAINATHLFSLFTADIIREEVVFTR